MHSSAKRHCHTGTSPAQGHENVQGPRETDVQRVSGVTGPFQSEENSKGSFIRVYNYFMGVYTEDRARFFSELKFVAGQKAMDVSWNTGEFWLDIVEEGNLLRSWLTMGMSLWNPVLGCILRSWQNSSLKYLI